MTHAPSTKPGIGGERLGANLSSIEVVAEWGFAHGPECTYVGYDCKQFLYPRQVLVLEPCQEHREEVRISLKDARKKAKLSQERLGELADSGRSTIVKLEKGELPLSEAWAKRLAPHLHVRPEQLFEPPQIPIVGYVGAGQRVYAYEDMLDAGDTIDRPPMVQGDLLAVEVKGESMLPLAEEGWHIVYTAEATVDENMVLERVCVVQLDDDDGSMLVKRVRKGSKDYHYHLLSTNADPIIDARLKWAAVVKAIVPR